MSLTYLKKRRIAGIADPAEVITVTIGGRTFRAGRHTAAHLIVTFAAFPARFPDLHLLLTQPCYNTGVEASAGTHDYDGVIDFYVMRNGSVLASTDADYWAVQRFLRELGWAAWFRHTGSWSSRSSWHLHAVSLGCPGPVGIYVPGQVDDYERHAYGLKDQHTSDLDHSWFPDDIDATYFDFALWEREMEDDMPYTEEQLRTIVREEVDAALAPLEREVARRGKGALERDKRLIKLARETQDDVDTLLAKAEQS